MRVRNELRRVLGTIEAFRKEGTTRQVFARRHRLHPSALSRILRVGELPGEVLEELQGLPRLTRTHLEVLASAPEERRAEILAALREGSSTYELRARASREERRDALPCPAPASAPPLRAVDQARLDEIARGLGASSEEALAFAGELLSVLWRQSPGRLGESFDSFRAARTAG